MLKLIFIFSTLFSLHFLQYWQGELVSLSGTSFVGDNFFFSSHGLNPLNLNSNMRILHTVLYTFTSADKENLFNNQELL